MPPRRLFAGVVAASHAANNQRDTIAPLRIQEEDSAMRWRRYDDDRKKKNPRILDYTCRG